MKSDERLRLEEILIFDYRMANQAVLDMTDEELQEAYTELKSWQIAD
jgi:hypothetical protein